MPHAARPTVTLHDVAAAAGVSLSTASRVLGGSSRTVAPEYEQRVLAAAAELRYTADASARAMRRASDAITLIADDLTTPSIGIVVAAMELQARTAGAFVTVSSTRGDPQRQLEAVRRLRALRPRALVLTSGRITANTLRGRLLNELLAYEHDGGRVVIVAETDMAFDSIGFDDYGAAVELGRYLAGSGHRRVVILAGVRGQATASARASGFVDGLNGGGVDDRSIRMVNCEMSRQGGFLAVQRLLATGLGDTDAILAANDVVAIGAMSALRAAGVAVPGDVSVTGFDDLQLAVDVTPRLTTVALPLAQVGADAIRLAVAPAAQKAPAVAPAEPEATATQDRAQPRRLVVHGHLVVRDSTRAR